MSRMPALYLSHGAPPLADDPLWPGQLAAWSAELPRPTAILVVSAHWEEAPLTIGATTPVPLIYDFWGFPEHYYQRHLSRARRSRAGGQGARSCSRHPGARRAGARSRPRRLRAVGGDVPGRRRAGPADLHAHARSARLHELGRRLAPLRDEGVLIVGSGFFTHNLHALQEAGSTDGPAPTWSREFDAWGAEALAANDVDSVLDFARAAPAARLAHPRTEHFAPLFVTLGASVDDGPGRTVVDGYWYGLAKRSLQFG